MAHQVTPRVDMAFKKIFGVEENKDLTMSLINSIVSEEDQVKDITILNPYNPKNFANDKLSILDVKAVGHNNKRYNIEIQVTDEADYDRRALYYWAKLYTEQLKEGENYSKLNKAIGIHILNFLSIPESKKYHNVFHVKEKDEDISYFNDLELHTIELKKFEKGLSEDLQEFVKKIKTSLDVWASFLTRHNYMTPEGLPKQLDRPDLKKALDVLDHINLGDTERDLYESRVKWLQVETNALEKRFQEGREEGIEKGREEGEKAGLEKGEVNTLLKLLKGKIISRDVVVSNLKEKGYSEKEIEKLLS